jgi:hypothetical protein
MPWPLPVGCGAVSLLLLDFQNYHATKLDLTPFAP